MSFNTVTEKQRNTRVIPVGSARALRISLTTLLIFSFSQPVFLHWLDYMFDFCFENLIFVMFVIGPMLRTPPLSHECEALGRRVDSPSSVVSDARKLNQTSATSPAD